MFVKENSIKVFKNELICCFLYGFYCVLVLKKPKENTCGLLINWCNHLTVFEVETFITVTVCLSGYYLYFLSVLWD